MRRRTLSGYGLPSKRLRLVLDEKRWANLERAADARRLTIPAMVELCIVDWLYLWLKSVEAGPVVYYDAQGGEHEEADLPVVSGGRE